MNKYHTEWQAVRPEMKREQILHQGKNPKHTLRATSWGFLALTVPGPKHHWKYVNRPQKSSVQSPRELKDSQLIKKSVYKLLHLVINWTEPRRGRQAFVLGSFPSVGQAQP